MGLSTIVIIYFLLSVYLSRELAAILGIQSIKYKLLYYSLYFTLAMSYILSRLLSSYSPNSFTDFIALIGGHAIPTTFYAIILLVTYKIIQFAYVKYSGQAQLLAPIYAFYLLASLLLIINLYGLYNGTQHVTKVYDIEIDKNIPATKIVMVTDLHLGKTTSRAYVQEMVASINQQHPDLVFLVGDIIDSDLESVLRKDLLSPLNTIQSKDGVYAVLGNHEYISKRPLEIIKLLGANNIKMLVDQSQEISGRNISLIGLNDIGHRSPDTRDEKTLQLLLSRIPEHNAVILLDHQPKRIAMASRNNIELAVSGHTHRGQYWPNGYISQQIFLNDWGLKKFANMYSLVSSGYGNWGANMRVGSRVEMVVINLKPKAQ